MSFPLKQNTGLFRIVCQDASRQIQNHSVRLSACIKERRFQYVAELKGKPVRIIGQQTEKYFLDILATEKECNQR